MAAPSYDTATRSAPGEASMNLEPLKDGSYFTLELESHPGQYLQFDLQGKHGTPGERRWHLWKLNLSNSKDRKGRLTIRGDPSNCVLVDEVENTSIEIDS